MYDDQAGDLLGHGVQDGLDGFGVEDRHGGAGLLPPLQGSLVTGHSNGLPGDLHWAGHCVTRGVCAQVGRDKDRSEASPARGRWERAKML